MPGHGTVPNVLTGYSVQVRDSRMTNPGIRKISTVAIFTKDHPRSLAFYRDTLRLSPVYQADKFAEFDVGGVHLMLLGDLPTDERRSWGLGPEPAQRGWGVFAHFQVESVDDVHEHLRRSGAEIVVEPKNTPWGARLCIVRDPDGYLLEFTQPVA